MTKQHTPGPWSRNISADGKYPTIFAGRNQHVAVASQQKDPAETEANISLIAAAPELLEACAQALAAMELNGHAAEYTPGLLRAAIAKARGEAVTK